MCAIVTRRIFPRAGPTHSICACTWMQVGKIRLARETNPSTVTLAAHARQGLNIYNIYRKNGPFIQLG